MKRVLLFMPTISWEIPVSMVNFLLSMNKSWCELTFRTSSRLLIHSARNIAVESCIKENFDYLLFLDDDNPPTHTDFLQRLLSHDVDIVSWVYRQRTDSKKLSICKWEIQPETGMMRYVPYENLKTKWQDLMQVENTGCWCVLIKREVCEALYNKYLQRPFENRVINYYKTKSMQPTDMKFMEDNIQNIVTVEPHIDEDSWEKMIFQARELSEDYLFFERARQLWFKVYADPLVKCRHIWPHTILEV